MQFKWDEFTAVELENFARILAQEEAEAINVVRRGVWELLNPVLTQCTAVWRHGCNHVLLPFRYRFVTRQKGKSLKLALQCYKVRRVRYPSVVPSIPC